MTVPDLPPELWIRIFTHLKPATLSSLSEVSKTFYMCATDESLFRRHLIANETANPARLYRRLQALHFLPDTQVSVHSSTRTELLCVVSDTLILCDFERSHLICFPSGLSVDIEEKLESDETILWNLQMLNIQKRHVVLPEGNLGFMYDTNPARFAVMDVKTGDIVGLPLHGGRLPPRKIADGKDVVIAGNNAEWIAYYVEDNKIALVDWRNGTMVSEIAGVPNDVKYLLGECSIINGSTLVGIVFEEQKGPVKEVCARGFDSVEMKFQVDEGKGVHSVLRSIDKKTHVLVTVSGTDHQIKKEFYACRKEAKGEKWWNDKLSMSSNPILQDNGRVIVTKSEVISMESTLNYVQAELFSRSSAKQLWVELKDDNTTKAATVPLPTYAGIPVWVRRTADGGFALIAETASSRVFLVKIVNDRRFARCIQLRHWTIHDMFSLHVVDDHYIVAQNRGGRIITFHFDWFCHEGKGIYACPGIVEREQDDFDGPLENLDVWDLRRVSDGF